MTGHHIEPGDHQSVLRRKPDNGSGPDAQTPIHPLLTLQSQIGNAQVARLLAQREEAPDDEIQGKHDLAQREEAPDDEIQGSHDLAQRDDDLAQRDEDEHVGIEGGPVGPDTAQQIQSARGGGSALDSNVQARMESGFGTDFSDVRVHQDAASNTLNRRLTSHAFTTGSDIFLRGDASASDDHLIAHELTHVVQQRSMTGGGSMSVGAAGDSHEQHADTMASTVLSGATAAAAPATAQREEAPDDELQGMHDLAQREEAPDDELQGMHDVSLQREEAPDDEQS
jgi:hypothetical protein